MIEGNRAPAFEPTDTIGVEAIRSGDSHREAIPNRVRGRDLGPAAIPGSRATARDAAVEPLIRLIVAISAVLSRYARASAVRTILRTEGPEQPKASLALTLDIDPDTALDGLRTGICDADAAIAGLVFGGVSGGARAARSEPLSLTVSATEGFCQEPLSLRVDLASVRLDPAFVSWPSIWGLPEAEGFLRAVRSVLEGWGERSAVPIARLPLLSAGDKSRLISEATGTVAPYPRDATVPQLFADQVAKRPDAVALRCGERSLTYRAFDAATDGLALRLIRLGVKPGMKVGLLLERSIEAIEAHLAILKTGAAYVPLDLTFPHAALADIVADSGPVAVVSSRSALDGLPFAAPWSCQTLLVDEADDAGAPVARGTLPPLGRATDLAYVMYTSGSTGRSKGVMIPHRAIARLVKNANFAALGPDEVFLQLAPLAFDAATLEIWGPLLNGGELVVMPPGRASLDEIGRTIRQNRITTLWLTAGLFHLMADGPLGDLASLRQLLAGGDVLSPRHVRKVLDGLPGIRLINGYGPTENTTFTCCHTVAQDHPADHPIPIGTAVANTEVYVLDERLELVPPGAVGQLCTAGDGLALGYLGRADLTRERFVRNPFAEREGEKLYLTGDLVRRQPDGALAFLGRADNQVKINGKRVELEEIEAALRNCPGVANAAVALHQEAPGAKSIAAYFVPRPGSVASVDMLRAALARRLPAHMVPASYVALATLPLNPNGKVDRRALPKPGRARPDLGRPFVTPVGAAEIRIAAEWSKVLNLETIGAEDNFFDLGGTSLQATALHRTLRDAFDPKLGITDLFAHPTVRALAARIGRATDGGLDIEMARARAARQSAMLRRLRNNHAS